MPIITLVLLLLFNTFIIIIISIKNYVYSSGSMVAWRKISHLKSHIWASYASPTHFTLLLMRPLNACHFNCTHPVCSFILFSLKGDRAKMAQIDSKMPSSRKMRRRSMSSLSTVLDQLFISSPFDTPFKNSELWEYGLNLWNRYQRINWPLHIIALACCFVPLNNLNKLFSDQISPDETELCLKHPLFSFQG